MRRCILMFGAAR